MYGHGSGEYRFRQAMGAIPDLESNNNGTPQPAGNPRLFYAGGVTGVLLHVFTRNMHQTQLKNIQGYCKAWKL